MAVVQIPNLPAAIALSGSEQLEAVQAGTSVRLTVAQIGQALGSPAPPNLSLQFNNGGVFGGSSGITTDGVARITLGDQQTTRGSLVLANTAAGAWPVTIQSSNSATAAWTMTLPPAVAAGNGFILTSNTSGVTSWTNPTALGIDLDVGSTAITNGTVSRLLFQGTGDVLQQSANLTFSSSTLTLGVAGSATGAAAFTGATSGTATITAQATAGSPTLTLPNASGTLVSTASAPLSINATTGAISITGAAGQVLAGATPAFTATPTLGVAGTTAGTLALSGATSGTVTLQTAAVAGTGTIFQFPSSNGANGTVLTTTGSGVTTWTSPSALGIDLDVGSTAITNGTAGLLLFQGAGNVLQQNADLVWDGSRLSLGANTADLIALRLRSANSNAAIIQFTNNPVTAQTAFIIGTDAGELRFGGASISTIYASGNEAIRITSAGDVSIKGLGTAGVSQAVSFSGSAPINSLVVDSGGRLGLGGSPTTQTTVRIAGNVTGNTTQYGVLYEKVAQSDVTGAFIGFTTSMQTQAASFALTDLRHFSASFITIGAGSSVTNQYGFFTSNLIGATNNYGFYSNIASGSGRWNFFANGTAANYFAGNVGIGVSPSTILDVYRSSNGTETIRINNDNAGASAQAQITLQSNAGQINIAQGSTANSGGYGIMDIGTAGDFYFRKVNASGSIVWTTGGYTERMRITNAGAVNIVGGGSSGSPAVSINGSAPINSLVMDSAGNIAVGTSSALSNFYVAKNLSGANPYGIASRGTITSDVTGTAIYYDTGSFTQAATFTLGALIHYRAFSFGLGAGSTVTAQYGFLAPAGTEATTNFQFYAGNAAAITAGKTNYAFYAENNTATGGGTTWNFFANGTAANYFAGNVGIGISPSYRIDGYSNSTANTYVCRLLSEPAPSGTSFTYLRIEKGSTYGGAVGGYLSQGVGSGLSLFTLNGGTLRECVRIADTGAVNIIGAGTAGSSQAVSISGSAPINSLVVAATTGRVGIGQPSPSYQLDVSGTCRVTGDLFADNGITSTYAFPLNASSSGSYAPQLLITNSAADSTAGYFYFAKGRAGNTTSQSGDDIGTLLFQGRDTSNTLTQVGAITARQTAAAGAGSVPGALLFFTGGTERLRIDSSGNLLVGSTNASPTTGTKCLTIETGTAATATPADTVTFYSTDLSAGNTIPSIYTEGTGIVSANAGTTNLSNRIAVRINGTVYYLLAASSA